MKEYTYFTVVVDEQGVGNLESLNQMIQKEGWHPVRECPMGVGGGGESHQFRAAGLVLLERDKTKPRP